MWKLNKVLLLLLCASETQSFTIHSQLSHPATVANTKTILNQQVHDDDQLDEIGGVRRKNQYEQKQSQMVQKKNLRTFGRILIERSDTLRSAGFYDDAKKASNKEQEYYEPLMAGAKTNITLFLLALGYKWYRSIFINKVRSRDRKKSCEFNNIFEMLKIHLDMYSKWWRKDVVMSVKICVCLGKT